MLRIDSEYLNYLRELKLAKQRGLLIGSIIQRIWIQERSSTQVDLADRLMREFLFHRFDESQHVY